MMHASVAHPLVVTCSASFTTICMQLDMDGVTYTLQWLVYAAKICPNP